MTEIVCRSPQEIEDECVLFALDYCEKQLKLGYNLVSPSKRTQFTSLKWRLEQVVLGQLSYRKAFAVNPEFPVSWIALHV